jgi:hypothetical protein
MVAALSPLNGVLLLPRALMKPWSLVPAPPPRLRMSILAGNHFKFNFKFNVKVKFKYLNFNFNVHATLRKIE